MNKKVSLMALFFAVASNYAPIYAAGYESTEHPTSFLGDSSDSDKGVGIPKGKLLMNDLKTIAAIAIITKPFKEEDYGFYGHKACASKHPKRHKFGKK